MAKSGNSMDGRDGHQPQRRRRRLAYVPLLVLLGLAVLALPTACTTTIVPPRDVTDPVTVFVLDHGRTASLVLTDGEGGAVRYAFGDWNYYALWNTGPHRVVAALAWPTQGALGWKTLESAADPAAIRRHVYVEIDDIHELRVNRQRAERLRARLEQAARDRIATHVVNERVDLQFVHYPRRYTYFHNSNHEVADWLRQLDCQIRGPAVISRWRVE